MEKIVTEEKNNNEWELYGRQYLLVAERMILDYENIIDKLFLHVEDLFDREIDNFYSNYYSNAKTLYENSKKSLSGREQEKFIDYVKKWREEATIPKLNDFITFCDLLMSKTKITRLEYLQSRLICSLEFYVDYFKYFTNETLMTVCITQHYLQQYLLLHCSGKRFPFIEMTKKDYKNIVKTKKRDVTYLENIHLFTRTMKHFIQVIIPEKFAQGEKCQKIKRELSKMLEKFRDAIKFYVRTEASRICTDIVLNICNEQDICEYTVYCACGSEDEECKVMNGQVFQVEDAVYSKTTPPFINLCRAFIVPCLNNFMLTYKDGVFPNIILKNYLIRYGEPEYVDYIKDYISGL